MSRKVYADNAATTAVAPQVLEPCCPFIRKCMATPPACTPWAKRPKSPWKRPARPWPAAWRPASGNLLYQLRHRKRQLAIKGAAHAMKKKGKDHIITSAFEHHAVLHTCQALEKEALPSPTCRCTRTASSGRRSWRPPWRTTGCCSTTMYLTRKTGGGVLHADGVTPVSRPNQTQPQAPSLTRDWAAC